MESDVEIETNKEENIRMNGHPLIVVVDDDWSIVEGLALLLGSWGYEVKSALNFTALVECLHRLERTPDLIIADHYLPAGHTGAEAVELLRQSAGTAIPAIILTGDTALVRQDEARSLNSTLLLKPVQVMALRETMERLILASRPPS
jgi:CheY-like chemotaxis protein